LSHPVSQLRLCFHPLKPIDVDFCAPDLSSDGGLLLVRMLDDQLQLSARIASVLPDTRRQKSVIHSRIDQVRQRLFGILHGYVDCNDASKLRADPLLKLALDRLPSDLNGLSSQPSLWRFEHCVSADVIGSLLDLLEDRFVEDLPAKTREVVLDVDGTWNPTHGTQQQLALFNGHYDDTGFLPLLIFDEHGRIASVLLRAGNVPDSTSALTLLSSIIRKLRVRFPTIRVIVRADAAFSMPEVMNGLEALSSHKSRVEFLFGIKSNTRLNQYVHDTVAAARAWKPGQRRFIAFTYQARSWPAPRRIIARILATEKGPIVRFVVTTLHKHARRLYVDDYCQRGQAENYIKELKCGTHADRLSCGCFEVNAFRLLLHSFAYSLLWSLRQRAAAIDKTWRTVSIPRLREGLLKVAVCVSTSVRRLHIQFAHSFIHKATFHGIMQHLQHATG
jgi:hypothetical protein